MKRYITYCYTILHGPICYNVMHYMAPYGIMQYTTGGDEALHHILLYYTTWPPGTIRYDEIVARLGLCTPLPEYISSGGLGMPSTRLVLHIIKKNAEVRSCPITSPASASACIAPRSYRDRIEVYCSALQIRASALPYVAGTYAYCSRILQFAAPCYGDSSTPERHQSIIASCVPRSY